MLFKDFASLCFGRKLKGLKHVVDFILLELLPSIVGLDDSCEGKSPGMNGPILYCECEKYNTGELGYDRLNGTRKIGPSYAKSVVYI